MAGSVGYFEDIESRKDQYYWLTPHQYTIWRKICYGKDKGEASAEIKWLIAVLGLIETTEQNKTTEQNERLYFIDVTTVESLDVLMNYFVSHAVLMSYLRHTLS